MLLVISKITLENLVSFRKEQPASGLSSSHTACPEVHPSSYPVGTDNSSQGLKRLDNEAG
jgi:hypothetical protein